MAVFALVQSRSFCSTAAATTFSVTLPLTPTNTNTIILTVVSNATVATPTGYTLASSNINSTGTYIFYKIAGASESPTITLVPSSSADIAVRVYEYTGLATASVFDKQVNASPASSTSQASGSTATLSQASELCIAVYGYPHNAYGWIPSAWTNSFIPDGALFATTGTDKPANATAIKVVAATTAVSTTLTVPTAASGNSLCIATFKITGTTLTGKPSNYVDSMLHFENSTAGTVLTNTILAASISGAFSDRWFTVSAPDAQTPGATPGLTIETGASHAQDKDILVEGASFLNASSGTRGLRATQSDNNCIQLSTGQAGDIALGMHWRWHGAQIDSSPRDIVALRTDPSGNYQFVQCVDGASPSIHVHYQPTAGTGVGSEITVAKDHWYWLQITHVKGGATCTLNVYDAENSYTLVGTSTGAVTGTESIGTTTIQIGQIKYAAGSSQWMDFDNITLSMDSVTPLLPTMPIAVLTITESATATDAMTCIVVTSAARVEAATATDSVAGVATLIAAIAEAGTAVDTPAATKVTAAAIAEAATAADTPAGVMTTSQAITEAATAADSTAGANTSSAAVTEAGTAGDTVSQSTSGIVQQIAEAATATDTSSATMSTTAARVEVATASDSVSVVTNTTQAVIESSTATEVVNQGGSISNLAIVENTTASDSVVAATAFAVQLVEAGVATDVASATAILAVLLTEIATAADSTATHGTIPVSITESMNAADTVRWLALAFSLLRAFAFDVETRSHSFPAETRSYIFPANTRS